MTMQTQKAPLTFLTKMQKLRFLPEKMQKIENFEVGQLFFIIFFLIR